MSFECIPWFVTDPVYTDEAGNTYPRGLQLCTVDDVLNECKNIEALVRFTIPDSDTEDGNVILAIDKAKAYIRKKLLNIAKEIFEHSIPSRYDITLTSWLAANDSDTMDTVLDRIVNPTELREYAVLCTMEQLLLHGNTVVAIDYDEAGRMTLKEEIAIRKKEAWDDAWKLIKFDINADGVVDDSERGTRGFQFSRV